MGLMKIQSLGLDHICLTEDKSLNTVLKYLIIYPSLEEFHKCQFLGLSYSFCSSMILQPFSLTPVVTCMLMTQTYTVMVLH